MSTARMKRRAKKKVWKLYGIQPCREITFRDGTVLLTYTVEPKPKPCCKKSARRRPTWGWRKNWRWSVLGKPRPSDSRPTLICSDDADNARWAEAAKPLLNDLNRQIARKLGTPPDSP